MMSQTIGFAQIVAYGKRSISLFSMKRANSMSTLRDRILDSAVEVVAESGWSAVTMVAVGERAGVSRQSVYNEIGSKPLLAEALIAREVTFFLRAVSAAIEGESQPNDSVRAAACSVFSIASDNVLLAAALSPGSDAATELLPLLTTQSAPILEGAAGLVIDSLDRQYPEILPEGEILRAAVVVVVRLVLSYLIRPLGSPEQMADQVGWVAAQLLSDESAPAVIAGN